MKPLPRFGLTAIGATLGAMSLTLMGCAGPAYSELYGTRYHRATMDTYPVTVTRVDDQAYVERPVRVEPGQRKVSVQGPPGGGQNVGSIHTIDLDVKACTRYYLVAVKDNRLAQDFTVKVDHEEPMGGCRPPA